MKKTKLLLVILVTLISALVIYSLHNNFLLESTIHKSGSDNFQFTGHLEKSALHGAYNKIRDASSGVKIQHQGLDTILHNIRNGITGQKLAKTTTESKSAKLKLNQAVVVPKSDKSGSGLFRILNATHGEKVESSCNILEMHADKNTRHAKICAYPRHQDIWVSGTLQDAGRWESAIMDAMERLYQQNPNLAFIDIGANIGAFTLLAALWGRKVVAVEANPNNAYRLMNSVNRNKFGDLVTVVNNAVSDNHDPVRMVVDKTNRGGSIVISDKAGLRSRAGIPVSQQEFVQDVPSIHMNDLVNLTLNFGKSILKIDIEGYESVAFSKSKTLFEKAGICYIFMEWHWLKEEGGAGSVYQLLAGLGFRPYADAMFDEKLSSLKDVNEVNGMNVYWKQDSC